MTDKTITAVLKEQFALIATLVVLIGTIYTDSYYAVFGLKYQSLNLPASHILYRGFTAVIDAPYLAVPYLLVVAWLAVEASRTTSKSKERIPIWASYAVIVAVLGMTYPLATHAGLRAGARDLSLKSRLPVVERLLPSDPSDTPCQVGACRLLLVDDSYLYVFVPQADGSIPHLKRLDRKVFHEIDTGIQ
jgi:hypothetical protein